MNIHILDGNCCLRTLLLMVTAQRLSGSATSACSPAAKYHAQHSDTLGCCFQQPQHTEYLALSCRLSSIRAPRAEVLDWCMLTKTARRYTSMHLNV